MVCHCLHWMTKSTSHGTTIINDRPQSRNFPAWFLDLWLRWNQTSLGRLRPTVSLGMVASSHFHGLLWAKQHFCSEIAAKLRSFLLGISCYFLLNVMAFKFGNCVISWSNYPGNPGPDRKQNIWWALLQDPQVQLLSPGSHPMCVNDVTILTIIFGNIYNIFQWSVNMIYIKYLTMHL